MIIKTKIIATLGPATSSVESIKGLLDAGVDVFRINFSHGTDLFIADLFDRVNELRNDYPHIGILADLEGPKVRVGDFENGHAELVEGEEFILDSSLKHKLGNNKQVYLDYKAFAGQLVQGDLLLLDDGNIKLEVKSTDETKVQCKIIDGGNLSNRKGVNKKGGGLSAEAIGPKDIKNIEVSHLKHADYIAVSFVKSDLDIQIVREELALVGSKLRIIAKIETVEALANIEKIIDASDGIMIARGDLGIEIGYEKLTGFQKQLIKQSRSRHKIAITATQMLESMINNKSPTRAEVSDVANAVMDGSDAVMLSAETAIGSYPNEVVKTMQSLCIGAEEHDQILSPSNIRLDENFNTTVESIAMACIYIASHVNIKAIVSLTETGETVHWMSRQLSKIPIYGLTKNYNALRRMSLFRGVTPFLINQDKSNIDSDSALGILNQFLGKLNTLERGDLIIFTYGDFMAHTGETNQLKILTVP